MFRLIGILLCAATVSCSSSEASLTSHSLPLQITPCVVDLGSVPRGFTFPFQFQLVNVGSSELTLTKIESSCTCMIPDLELPFGLEAGRAQEISGHITSPLRRQGFSYFVRVTVRDSGSGEEERIQLAVEGIADFDLAFAPDGVQVDHYVGASPVTETVTWKSHEPLALESLDDDLLPGVTLETTAQTTDRAGSFSLTFDTPEAPFAEKRFVSLSFDRWPGARYRLPVSWSVTPPVELDPPSVILRCAQGSASPWTEVQVRPRDGRRLTPSDVRLTVPEGIEAETTQEAAGPLVVRVRASALPPRPLKTIEIGTARNHPVRLPVFVLAQASERMTDD